MSVYTHITVERGDQADLVLLICYSLEEDLTKGKKEGATPGSSFKPWNGEKKAERSSTRGQERVERATVSSFKKKFCNLVEGGD